ncbi:hypothetical protein SALBM311S_03496 [Streptomyces alboniger]
MDGWAFAIECASAEGTDRPTLERVSQGTDAVVLLDSGTPPYWFVHARDGEIASDFEPGVEAEQIGGTHPSFLVPAMREAGMLLPDGTADPDDWEPERRILTVAEQVFSLDLPRTAIEGDSLPAVVLVYIFVPGAGTAGIGFNVNDATESLALVDGIPSLADRLGASPQTPRGPTRRQA